MFRTKSKFESRNRTGRMPLRILFALPGLHRVVRGAEVAFEEISRRIARRPGFEVTLIGSGPRRLDEPYHYVQSACIVREKFEKFPSIPYLRDHYAYEEISFAPGLHARILSRGFRCHCHVWISIYELGASLAAPPSLAPACVCHAERRLDDPPSGLGVQAFRLRRTDLHQPRLLSKPP